MGGKENDKHGGEGPRLVKPAEAAAFLGTTPGMLSQDRHAPTWGVPFVRLGRRGIRYDLVDLEAFIQRRRVVPDVGEDGAR